MKQQPVAIKTKRDWMMPRIPLPVTQFEQPPFPLLPVFVQTHREPQQVLVLGNMQSDAVPPSQLYAKPLPLYNIPYYKYPKPIIPFNDYLPPSNLAESEDNELAVKMNEIESRTTPSTISKPEKPESDNTMKMMIMMPTTITTTTITTAGQPVVEKEWNEMGTKQEPDMPITNQATVEPVIMIEDLKTTTMVPVDLETDEQTPGTSSRMFDVEEQTDEPAIADVASTTVVPVEEEREQVATTPSEIENVDEEQEQEQVATTPKGIEDVEEEQAVTTRKEVENVEEEQVATIAPTTLINSVVTEQQKVDGTEATEATTESVSNEVNEAVVTTTVGRDEIEQEKGQTESSAVENSVVTTEHEISLATTQSSDELGDKMGSESPAEIDNEEQQQQQFDGYYYPKPAKTFIS